ncbi:hypothetical protein NL676_030639 [Syzygium grande]|nr:hypothetical protein NL676_030639 [Syzygium grande]
MQLGGGCGSQGPPKKKNLKTFTTRPGPTTGSRARRRHSGRSGPRRWWSCRRSRGRRWWQGRRYGPWRGGESWGRELALVEELVGNAEGGGGAGREMVNSKSEEEDEKEWGRRRGERRVLEWVIQGFCLFSLP